jgi:hypothetical protein
MLSYGRQAGSVNWATVLLLVLQETVSERQRSTDNILSLLSQCGRMDKTQSLLYVILLHTRRQRGLGSHRLADRVVR